MTSKLKFDSKNTSGLNLPAGKGDDRERDPDPNFNQNQNIDQNLSMDRNRHQNPTWVREKNVLGIPTGPGVRIMQPAIKPFQPVKKLPLRPSLQLYRRFRSHNLKHQFKIYRETIFHHEKKVLPSTSRSSSNPQSTSTFTPFFSPPGSGSGSNTNPFLNRRYRGQVPARVSPSPCFPGERDSKAKALLNSAPSIPRPTRWSVSSSKFGYNSSSKSKSSFYSLPTVAGSRNMSSSNSSNVCNNNKRLNNSFSLSFSKYRIGALDSWKEDQSGTGTVSKNRRVYAKPWRIHRKKRRHNDTKSRRMRREAIAQIENESESTKIIRTVSLPYCTPPPGRRRLPSAMPLLMNFSLPYPEKYNDHDLRKISSYSIKDPDRTKEGEEENEFEKLRKQQREEEELLKKMRRSNSLHKPENSEKTYCNYHQHPSSSLRYNTTNYIYQDPNPNLNSYSYGPPTCNWISNSTASCSNPYQLCFPQPQLNMYKAQVQPKSQPHQQLSKANQPQFLLPPGNQFRTSVLSMNEAGLQLQARNNCMYMYHHHPQPYNSPESQSLSTPMPVWKAEPTPNLNYLGPGPSNSNLVSPVKWPYALSLTSNFGVQKSNSLSGNNNIGMNHMQPKTKTGKKRCSRKKQKEKNNRSWNKNTKFFTMPNHIKFGKFPLDKL